ncbi:MAG: T9SS type A sorting domain-containing protein [Bacteroidetes bacterium]|nr:T9SS type A sorting domain-containing protein [Bacteroidota bacterium]
MKTILSFFFAITLFFNVFAQPIIDQNDMPLVGDTIRTSTAYNPSIDYASTGTNYLWDFSSLISTQQKIDSFVSVYSTPALYLLAFYNSSMAEPRPDITIIPNFKFTEVYNFYKSSSSSFSQLGLAAKINGIPAPLKYDDPDVWYHFPITYGEMDSSTFSYNVQIPSFGYYAQTIKRVNSVDGWGTIITPYDTFQATRVFSTKYIHDTIYIDSLIFGFAQDRVEKEYKWLADNMSIPVMNVSKSDAFLSIASFEYINKYRNSDNIIDHENPFNFCYISPNPANENTSVYFSLNVPSFIEINIFNILGENIKTISGKEFTAGNHSIPIVMPDRVKKGIYFARISTNNTLRTIKISIN